MAKLIVQRKKLLPGCFMRLHILAEGKVLLSLKNGEQGECEVPDGPVHLRCSLTLGRISDSYVLDLTDIPEVYVTVWANASFPVMEFSGPEGAMLPVEREETGRLPRFLY